MFETVLPSLGILRCGSRFASCVSVGGGFVASCSHHLRSGRGFVVRFGEREGAAELYALLPSFDLTVLRVPRLPSFVPPLTLADAVPSVGSPVLAIAQPGGAAVPYRRTVVGIRGAFSVFAEGRSVPLASGFLATARTCGPGSSGGPLIDERGMLAGIGVAFNNTHATYAPVDALRRMLPRGVRYFGERITAGDVRDVLVHRFGVSPDRV